MRPHTNRTLSGMVFGLKLPIYAFMQVIYHIFSLLSTWNSEKISFFLDDTRNITYNKQKYEMP